MTQAKTTPISPLASPGHDDTNRSGMTNPIGATRRAQSFRQPESSNPEFSALKSPISLGFLGKTKKFHSPLARQNVKILFQPPVSFS